MKKLSIQTVLFIAAVLMAASAMAGDLSAFKGLSGTLKIAGGTAHIPVMTAAAEKIMAMNPDIRISIAGGGSGLGIKQVGEGLVDIGNSGRKPKDTEVKTYDLRMFQWAIDGVGVVVHPKNPVKSLTHTQLQEIYSGKATNWKTLGGPDHAITVYTRDNSSGTREVFWKKAISQGDITDAAIFTKSNGAMKNAIAADPFGIGYVSVGHIDATVAPVALDGITPTLETVRSGAYPVARGLFSNTRGEPAGLTRAFIDYLFSPEGQALAASKGFIPVK